MPKPTQAELLQRFPSTTFSCRAEGRVAAKKSGSTELLSLKIGEGSHQDCGSGSSRASDPTSLDQASPSSVARCESYSTSWDTNFPRSSLPFFSSLSSLHGKRPCATSDHRDSSGWSDFGPPGAAYAPMCTPREAKELSIATGRFYVVTTLGRDGLVPGDEPQVDGMILHGYTNGKPIYYQYSG